MRRRLCVSHHVAKDHGSGEARVTGARSGWEGLVLLKTTGSSFVAFARDTYTSLPELVDRPLTLRMDAHWRHVTLAHATAEGPGALGARAVRDEIERTFHDFASRSIQHLVHEMGTRMLQRFPELAEAAFEAQNRLWDTVTVSQADPRTRVFADPRPAHGSIFLSLRRGSA